MPAEDMHWLQRSEILSFDEIESVAATFVERFAIASLRIT